MLARGAKAGILMPKLFVVGLMNTVPVPALMSPPTAELTPSAVRVMLLLLLEMVLLPIAMVAPAPVLIVTPAGPETFPLRAIFPLFTSVTEPALALAAKLTAPELFKLIFPAPADMVALRFPLVVWIAVPNPIAPLAEVR